VKNVAIEEKSMNIPISVPYDKTNFSYMSEVHRGQETHCKIHIPLTLLTKRWYNRLLRN